MSVFLSARKINVAKFHNKSVMVMVVTDVAVSVCRCAHNSPHMDI